MIINHEVLQIDVQLHFLGDFRENWHLWVGVFCICNTWSEEYYACMIRTNVSRIKTIFLELNKNQDMYSQSILGENLTYFV